MNLLSLSSAQHLQNVMAEKDPILLYFSTPHCNVCHAMWPKLLSALADYPYSLIEVDASRYPDLAGQHRVFVAPTVLVFYEGKEILRESRFIDIEKIQRLLDLIQSS